MQLTRAVISGTGLFTPAWTISNQDLVAAFNAYVRLHNDEHAADIASGELPALQESSVAGFDDLLPTSLTAEEFSDGLLGVRERFANNPNYAIFQITGTQHGWTQQSPGGVTSAGVNLSDWLSAFIDPSAAHASVIP